MAWGSIQPLRTDKGIFGHDYEGQCTAKESLNSWGWQWNSRMSVYWHCYLQEWHGMICCFRNFKFDMIVEYFLRLTRRKMKDGAGVWRGVLDLGWKIKPHFMKRGMNIICALFGTWTNMGHKLYNVTGSHHGAKRHVISAWPEVEYQTEMTVPCPWYINSFKQQLSLKPHPFDLWEVHSKNRFHSSSFQNTNTCYESFLAHCFGSAGHFLPFIIEFLAAALPFPHASVDTGSSGKTRVIAGDNRRKLPHRKEKPKTGY